MSFLNKNDMGISSKEFEAVTKLDPFARYKYFIKRVADIEKMYSLVGPDGEFAIVEIEERKLLSFWSAPDYALTAANGSWKDFSLKEITLEDFENDIIPQIEKDQLLINVFSIDNKSGFVVTLGEFVRDLNDELDKYP